MKKKNGFSFLELLIVIGFLAILVSLALSISTRGKSRMGIRNVAQEISGLFYKVKYRAIREFRTLRMTFNAHGYKFQTYNGTSWVDLNDPGFGSQSIDDAITIGSPLPDFALNPKGFLVKPDNPNQFAILGTQTVTLTSPGNQGTDTVTIQVFPYGGIHVSKVFQ
jgi:type II secretory pathway pseudopilin PulG